jgi:cation-transporting ATPase 13A2
MSESVPTSISSFAHRRSRADSTTSFTYFQGDGQAEWSNDEVVVDDSEDEIEFPELESDLESGVQPRTRRKSSALSRSSVDDPLLARRDSVRTDASGYGYSGRVSQKIYILTEDLTVVAAGFTTSTIGSIIYLVICFFTLGFGYLLFRWLPRWRIRLVGSPSPLRDCTWVAIEVSLLFGRNRSKTSAKAGQNQWGEITIHDVERQRYGQSLSTIFGSREKPPVRDYDEDEDPVITHLRSLDYRYIRFCYHPLKDKFILNNSWKDPAWTDVRAMRTGIDGDEKENRELVFGRNMIDIQEKSVTQLLFDEVRTAFAECETRNLPGLGFPPLLRVPNC